MPECVCALIRISSFAFIGSVYLSIDAVGEA
jgi:hypothetical protein